MTNGDFDDGEFIDGNFEDDYDEHMEMEDTVDYEPELKSDQHKDDTIIDDITVGDTFWIGGTAGYIYGDRLKDKNRRKRRNDSDSNNLSDIG